MKNTSSLNAEIVILFLLKIPTDEELELGYEGYGRNDYLSPITIKRYNDILDDFEKYKKTKNS